MPAAVGRWARVVTVDNDGVWLTREGHPSQVQGPYPSLTDPDLLVAGDKILIIPTGDGWVVLGQEVT